MTELKERTKQLEYQLSEMVFDFHKLNDIEPLLYKIQPVFRENQRATGDRLIFIGQNVIFSHTDFKDKIQPLIKSITDKVNEFCSENNITYLHGEINYIATMDDNVLNVYTNLLIKP